LPVVTRSLRKAIVAIHNWLLFPSLAVVLVSGLAAMAEHYPFAQARWVWAKAVTGIALFEGAPVTVIGTGRKVAELTATAVDAAPDPSVLAALLRAEWLGLWTILILSLLNVVLGVLPPRLEWQDAKR